MFYVFLYFIGINIFTAYNYYIDKQSAIYSDWRIPETNLLFFALIGGSPAALLSTHIFRHKIRKDSFMDLLYLIIGAQIVFIILKLNSFFNFHVTII